MLENRIGETLYGSKDMLELIWQNQNPKNCSEAKYIISAGYVRVGCTTTFLDLVFLLL